MSELRERVSEVPTLYFLQDSYDEQEDDMAAEQHARVHGWRRQPTTDGESE